MSNAHRASFELTPADFEALQSAYAARSFTTKHMYSAMFVGFGLAAWFLSPSAAWAFALIAAIGGAMALVRFVLIPLQWRSVFKRVKPALPNRVEASAEALRYAGVTFETTHAWPGVLRYSEDKNTIFLWVSTNSALIIPKRGFSSPSEAERFIDLVKQKTSHAS